MRQRTLSTKTSAEKAVRDIRRKTRKQYSVEEKIRIILDGLRGEESVAARCRREGIAESLYYSWSKEFLEAGKKRLAGDTGRQATSGEVKDLKRELHGNMLIVKGNKHSSHEEKNRTYYFSERTYGAFQRTFRLPSDVDDSSIEAVAADGVLTLRIPKRKEVETAKRTIQIQKK